MLLAARTESPAFQPIGRHDALIPSINNVQQMGEPDIESSSLPLLQFLPALVGSTLAGGVDAGDTTTLATAAAADEDEGGGVERVYQGQSL